MSNTVISTELAEAAKHMSGIANALGHIPRQYDRVEMAFNMAGDRKLFPDDKDFKKRIESRYTRQAIDDFNKKHAPIKDSMKLDDSELAEHLLAKKMGFERAANTLGAFAGLISDVQKGIAEHIESSLEHFQKIRRRYNGKENFNIVAELNAAQKWMDAEQDDFRSNIPYIIDPHNHAANVNLIANEAIGSKILPALGDGTTIVKAVVEEAQRIIGTDENRSHGEDARIGVIKGQFQR